MQLRFISFVLSVGFAATSFAQNSYTTTPINTPPSLPGSTLTWISDDGRYGVGYGFNNPPYVVQCFTYQDGVATVIPMPGLVCNALGAVGPGVYVFDLSYPYDGSTPQTAARNLFAGLVLSTNGKLTQIPVPDGATFNSLGARVNKNGQMPGALNCPGTPNPIPCAIIFSIDGTITRLPNLGGISIATGINDAGDAIGYVVNPGDDPYLGRHAVIWPHSGGMQDLSTLTTMKLGAPIGINTKGQVIGSRPYTSASGCPICLSGDPYFYDGTNFSALQLDGATLVNPESLNDNGEIVGTYLQTGGNGVGNPFYYANGKARDLNGSVANLPADMFIEGAYLITNTGQMLVEAAFTQQPSGALNNQQIYLLTPSNATVRPVIGGVVNSFSHLAGAASATWLEIQGQNLASHSRSWTAADFNGNALPTSLDGVSVTINGVPAYVSQIGPAQISVLAPDDPATGPVQVQVTNALGVSAPFTVTKSDTMPALMNNQVVASTVASRGYITATHADGTTVFYGYDANCHGCTAAKIGETITFYGTGFGPTAPTTSAGEMTGFPAKLANPVVATIGGQPATVVYAGRIASGLDQFNVTIPEIQIPTDINFGPNPPIQPDGQALIVLTVNGVSIPDYLYTVVSN